MFLFCNSAASWSVTYVLATDSIVATGGGAKRKLLAGLVGGAESVLAILKKLQVRANAPANTKHVGEEPNGTQ